MIAAMADEVSQRADRLLSLWSELSMLHVALGGACACGTSGISLRLDDFELDIVGYLEDVTMVVVEHGRTHLNEDVEFIVTRALQTSAGRMIFGRLADGQGAGAQRRHRGRNGSSSEPTS